MEERDAAARPLRPEGTWVKRISVVVLVYNEAANLSALYERLSAVLRALKGYDVELIFVDDGSQDESFTILRGFHERNPTAKVLRLSRNFGSWSAVAAGVAAATGDAVAWITSDLQDPPELIPDLVRRWESGADVVWAVRTRREDPWLRRTLATLFYRLLRRAGLPEYPLQGVDICLMDRRVAKTFNSLQERNRFTQALIMSLGFTQVAVPYVRERRRGGTSKWGTLPRLSKIAFDMIAGSSYYPFRAMLVVGGAMLALSLVLILTSLVRGLGILQRPSASLVIVAAVVGVGGLQAIMLGVLGEYLWRVLEEVRGRPYYIVRERLGFDEHRAAPRQKDFSQAAPPRRS